MGQGGVLYWRELYPDIGLTDGTDHRNLLIPADIKYELIDKIFVLLEKDLGCRVSDYEEYPLSEKVIKSLLELLNNVHNLSYEAQQWTQRAVPFIETAIDTGKTLGLAI